MKTFQFKIISLYTFILLSVFSFGQNLTTAYKRSLIDINYLNQSYQTLSDQAILYTQGGMTLYYGDEKSGNNDYIKLRNNGTIVWQTNVVSSQDNILPTAFHETENGYYFVGSFTGISGRGGVGRLNKSTGNFDVKKPFTDLSNPVIYAINSTFGNNIIVGGRMNDFTSQKAVLRVVNSLGETMTTKSNNTSGLWGQSIDQIVKGNDNSYIVSGYFYENTICGEPPNTSWWICKLDANLNVLWSKKYGDSNGTTKADRIVVLDNNEIIALGRTYCTNGTGGGLNNSGDGSWLAKLNPSGNLIMNKFVGINNLDYTVNYSDMRLACNKKLLLAGFEGGLLGVSVIVREFDYNLNQSSEVLGRLNTSNSGLERIGFQVGLDNTYLFYGDELLENNNRQSFVLKTNTDPSCGITPLLCQSNIGSFSLCENFDDLQNGNISPQGNPNFTLFSGQNDEQAQVVSEKSFSGGKSLKFTNTSDIDYNISRTINSPSRLEWMTYLDPGKTGAWGLETSNPGNYALVTQLNNGQGNVYTISSTNQLELRGTFTYTSGKWYKTALVFNNIANTIEVWVDKMMVYSRANHTSGVITDFNIYGTQNSSNNQFYIDDLLYYETNDTCTCPTNFDPVCVNNNEFPNSCFAQCSAYASSEWTTGSCGGSSTEIVEFDIDDNICGEVNSTISIPIKVLKFLKVSSLQFSISLADGTKGEIVGFEKGNVLGELNSGIISPTLATCLWDNTSQIDLADNTIIMYVKVKIKSFFMGSTDISIVGQPTNISAEQNGQTVNPIVTKGSYCSTLSKYNICGRITREDNVVIPNVIVNLSGGNTASTITNSNGEYCFNGLDASLNYTITPSKNTEHKNGILSGDVSLMRRHLLSLEKLNSPYKIIAADVSNNLKVNSGDISEIRQLILSFITEFPNKKSWTFVPKSFTFVNPSDPFISPFPSTIVINNLNANSINQDFIGIKNGDVNLSNNPSNFNDQVLNRNMIDLNIYVSSANVIKDQEFDIHITVGQFNEIINGQFSVNWDINQATFIGLKNLNTTLGLTEENFNTIIAQNGKLGFLWDETSPKNLTDNEILFTIRFLAKSNGMTSVSITDDPVEMYFENKDKQEVNVIVTNGNITVPAIEVNSDVQLTVFPNPTSGKIHILSDKDILETSILDFFGKSHKVEFDSYKYCDISHLQNGNYILKITFDDGVKYHPIILTK